jgi:isocitrate dehydrogenase (NAD+)
MDRFICRLVTRTSPLTRSFVPRRTHLTDLPDKRVVTLIPGDGIGPEISNSVVGVFQAAEVPVTWERFDSDPNQPERLLSNSLLASIARNKVALKGPLYTPTALGLTSRNRELRRALELYAQIVPIKSLPGVITRYSDIDLVIIRENTEGEYIGIEQKVVPGVVQSLKIITREASLRIAEVAFDYAVKNNRKKVSAIHKANIMKLSDGEFLKSCREVAKNYPSITYEEMIIDNCCMQLVMRPTQFDVMLTPNLYGAIVTNVASALIGGPGLIPGINLGKSEAVFEAGARHVGLDIRGKNKANPVGMLFSSVWLLRHLELFQHAQLIENAVFNVLKHHKAPTADVGGSASTKDFTQAVIDEIIAAGPSQ